MYNIEQTKAHILRKRYPYFKVHIFINLITKKKHTMITIINDIEYIKYYIYTSQVRLC